MQLVIPKPNRTFGAVDALAVVGAIGFAIARWVPIATLIPFWGCGFRKLTGIPCPGCGLTRVADRFAHFHFWKAFQANPLGTIAAGIFAGMMVLSVLHLVFKVPVPELHLAPKEERRMWLGAAFIATVNYAWVVYAYTSLHWR